MIEHAEIPENKTLQASRFTPDEMMCGIPAA